MRRFSFAGLALLAAGGLASAQSHPGHGAVRSGSYPASQPCPPSLLPGSPGVPVSPTVPPTSPGTPTPPSTPQSSAPSTGSDALGAALAGGGGGAGFFQGTLAAPGTGLSSATTVATAAGGFTNASVLNQIQTASQPLILPGLFTAINPEFARPVDRVFLSYGYFDRFNVTTPTGVQPGFNLNRYDVGLEKTFLNGRASAYVRVPILDAMSNNTGQAIDGLGDISAGIKFVLLSDACSGSCLTAGFTVAAPTSRDLIATTGRFAGQDQNGQIVFGPASIDPNGGDPAPRVLVPGPTTQKINPTFLQPWVAGLLSVNRFFIHEYFGVVIPTDGAVSTYINNDLSAGYSIQGRQGSFLTSITPTIGLQLLLPLNHVGSNGQVNTTAPIPAFTEATTVFPVGQTGDVTLRSSHQAFLTGGCQFGLGERTLLSTGVVVPVAGPRAYSWGVTAGLNFLF